MTTVASTRRTRGEPRVELPPAPDWMFITPAFAEELLEFNEHNRHKKPQKIQEFASDMLTGSWGWCQDAIVRDWSGNLINGQNRLYAIIASGIGQWLLFADGWPSESQKTMDSGRARDFGDNLSIDNVARARDLATMAKYVFYWERTGWPVANTAVTKSKLQDVVDRHSDLHLYLNHTLAYVRPGFARALAYILSRSSAELLEEFWQRANGIGADEADIERVLAHRLFQDSVNGRPVHNGHAAELIIRSWNHRYDGKSVTRLQKNSSNSKPPISGLKKGATSIWQA